MNLDEHVSWFRYGDRKGRCYERRTRRGFSLSIRSALIVLILCDIPSLRSIDWVVRGTRIMELMELED